jgi:hypothetical protein
VVVEAAKYRLQKFTYRAVWPVWVQAPLKCGFIFAAPETVAS